MAAVSARERGNPTPGDDASMTTSEYELSLSKSAQREDAQPFTSRVSNLDVDDHMRPLGERQFAGRQVKVTWVMSAPSVSKVQVV